MKNIGWTSQFLNHRPSLSGIRSAAGAVAAAMLLASAGMAGAQIPNTAVPAQTPEIKIPQGYSSHHSVDVGGRITNLVGGGPMYDTLVNLQSGPRVLGETFEMHALPDHKTGPFDDLNAFGSGFGGDPNTFAKLDFSKPKIYEFSGTFRRDRLYSDYGLLASANVPSGLSIPIGPSSSPTGALPWQNANRSPVMFNTVRRMTDINLTLAPFARFSYRFAYSQGTMEGPSLSPSYTLFGMKYNALLRQYERNGSDDFLGAVDWKPRQDTKISFEMQANHYRSDTNYTLDPGGIMVQESNGTPAYLGNFTSFVPYGTAACNASSMGGQPLLMAANTPGGLPIINPACAVVTSYIRSLPVRIWMPTGTIRLQSAAIKNVSMNGQFNYTLGNMDMPNYLESSQGLNGSIRSGVSTGGFAKAHRAVVGADYGIVWQASAVVSIGDQVDFSSVQQPGYSLIPAPVTMNTPATAGNQTINYSGTLTPGTGSLPHGVNGKVTSGFFGQEYLINNLTLGWDATSRVRLSLTYRISNRNIGQGTPHGGELAETDPVSGKVTINENAGVFNAFFRPTHKWDVNGSVEVGYDDNAFTPVSPRQFQMYRFHTLYRASSIATFTGSFSDRERHNNTSNVPAEEFLPNPTTGAAPSLTNYGIPIDHVDHSRIGSVGVVLTPNARYSFNFNYSYSDVYAATNICYNNGATATAPGAATVTGNGAPDLCVPLNTTASPSTWYGRDFMDAPTNFGSVGLMYAPIEKFKADLGYTVSAVSGSRFFNDARDVNGMLASTYQSPVVKLAWTFRPGLTWRAEYNFFGYGEGGASGAALCSTSTSLTSSVAPCASLPYPTGLTESPSGLAVPRNFHANNLTLAMHYEF
jgi:hypothetical protein